jgi:hypothetical protein
MLFVFCIEMRNFVLLRWLLLWSHYILKGNLYLQLFYQLSLRVSERVMNREIFFHAEISMSVKRLHSQRIQDLRIRTGKCADSSEGSLVAISSFTVIVMCCVVSGTYNYLRWRNHDKTKISFICRYLAERIMEHVNEGMTFVSSFLHLMIGNLSLNFFFSCEECFDQVLWPQYFLLTRLWVYFAYMQRNVLYSVTRGLVLQVFPLSWICS